MANPFSLEGKNAWITGASYGIGFNIAKAFVAAGVKTIVFNDINEAALQRGLDNYKEAGIENVKGYVCDVTDEAGVKALVEKIHEEVGQIDILVNNAGVAPKEREDILNMSRESMDRLLDINLKGTFFLTQYCANKMTELGFGEAIINITSMSAYTSSTSRGEYCISKAGLSMVTTLFADRLAEYGINVYEVRPGIIKTDMTATVNEKYDRLIGEGLLPIKRWGYPEDIGRAVVALAKGYLPYSTGEVINIDGGFHIRRL